MVDMENGRKKEEVEVETEENDCQDTKIIKAEHDESLDMKIIMLLDALDSYMKLYHSLAQKMRQGWMDMASARYSMGLSSINKPLFSLRPQHSYALVTVQQPNDACAQEKHHASFSLHMWEANSNNLKASKEEASSQLRHRTVSNAAANPKNEIKDSKDMETNSNVENVQIQRRRSEALSFFGTLVPPKLRLAQASFESALEVLVEIASLRSAILSVSAELLKERESDMPISNEH